MMKKAFEIWIDDDDDLIGLCGTIITKRSSDNDKTVNCCNFKEKDLFGKVGYYYPHSGPGMWFVRTPTDILIDKDE